VSVFQLSPGITPELTDIFVIELPLALALGYLLDRRTGFELAFALNAVALGVIKFVTDFSDPWDDLVSLGAVLGGGLWMGITHGWTNHHRALRIVAVAVGVFALVVGLIKLDDFYDPFDLLLADSVIASGIALLAYRNGYPGRTVGPARPAT
jgi:hypothetical protein